MADKPKEETIEIKIPKKQAEELKNQMQEGANGCGCGCIFGAQVKVDP